MAIADDPARQPLSRTPYRNYSEMNDCDDEDYSYTILRSGKRRKSTKRAESGLHATVSHGLVVVLETKDPDQQITKMNPLKLHEKLESMAPDGVIEARPNHCLDVLALDTRNIESTKSMLTIYNIKKIQPLTACLTSLLQLSNKIPKEKFLWLSFFDICSPYDQLEHWPILHSLQENEISGKLVAWISNCLTKHFFFVKTEDGCTERCKVVQGVPQGGVLCPTLFSIGMLSVVKALLKNVRSSFYTDDICLWSCSVRRDVAPAKFQKVIRSLSQILASLGLRIFA